MKHLHERKKLLLRKAGLTVTRGTIRDMAAIELNISDLGQCDIQFPTCGKQKEEGTKGPHRREQEEEGREPANEWQMPPHESILGSHVLLKVIC